MLYLAGKNFKDSILNKFKEIKEIMFKEKYDDHNSYLNISKENW